MIPSSTTASVPLQSSHADKGASPGAFRSEGRGLESLPQHLVAIIRRVVSSLRRGSVLSSRGFVIFLLALWMGLGPAWHEHDIVATIIAVSLLALLFTLSTICFVSWLQMKNRVSLSIFPPEGELTSQRSGNLILHLIGVRLPPFYRGVVEISLGGPEGVAPRAIASSLFGGRGHYQAVPPTKLPPVELTPDTPAEARMCVPFSFPHRGLWEFSSASLKIYDAFGLTRLEASVRWEGHRRVEVAPYPVAASHLPIISSSSTEGDFADERATASGDPFEFKPYNPALGARRIVWKMFARSGELFSRFPEMAAAPEGKAALFLVADPQDDAACSALRTHLRVLHDFSVETVVGCEGMGQLKVATSLSEANSLFSQSVWLTPSPHLLEDLDVFVKGATLAIPHLKNTLIFCSARRVGNDKGLKSILSLGDALIAKGIQPILVVVISENGLPQGGMPERYRPSGAMSSSPGSPLRWWFLGGQMKKIGPLRPPTELQYATAILQRGWEMYTTNVTALASIEA